MSGLLIATALSLASTSPDLQASVKSQNSWVDQAVDDRELDAVRGGQGVVFSSGRDGVPRLTRDVVVRELAIPRSLMEQQFDNWFNDVGAALIVANLTR